jgi:hypothetical protein
MGTPRKQLSLDEQHRRATLILFLRDSELLPFSTIGRRFGICGSTAKKIYLKTKGVGRSPRPTVWTEGR